MKNKLLIRIITIACIFLLIFGALYFASVTTGNRLKNEFEIVNKNFEYTKGIITKIKSYKGHSFRVKYTINGRDYEHAGPWYENPNHYVVGDSIMLRYAIDSPSLIITELQKEF